MKERNVLDNCKANSLRGFRYISVNFSKVKKFVVDNFIKLRDDNIKVSGMFVLTKHLRINFDMPEPSRMFWERFCFYRCVNIEFIVQLKLDVSFGW